MVENIFQFIQFFQFIFNLIHKSFGRKAWQLTDTIMGNVFGIHSA